MEGRAEFFTEDLEAVSAKDFRMAAIQNFQYIFLKRIVCVCNKSSSLDMYFHMNAKEWNNEIGKFYHSTCKSKALFPSPLF